MLNIVNITAHNPKTYQASQQNTPKFSLLIIDAPTMYDRYGLMMYC